MKQEWPAPERNKGPILEVLRRVLPDQGALLELASGSGQHAVHFAADRVGWTFQPSDIDEENLTSVQGWVVEAGLSNLLLPLRIDVRDADWGVEAFDAVFCANLIHIAPWECALGLLAGAGRHIRPGGHLVLYGPYRLEGEHTAPSNEAFDASLRSRDSTWGVRDAEAVIDVAVSHGLRFVERVPMPANNQTLVFQKSVGE